MKTIILSVMFCCIIASCESSKKKMVYYSKLHNIYMSVLEMDDCDCIILGDKDSIFTNKTNGYYSIELYFIDKSKEIYIDTLFCKVYKVHPYSYSYKWIKRNASYELTDSLPIKEGTCIKGTDFYSFSEYEKNDQYVGDLNIVKRVKP